MFYIYCLTNRVNGKKYVGQTSHTPEFRWSSHKRDAERKRLDTLFARAIRKHGADDFVLNVIGVAATSQLASEFERLWIRLLDTTNREKGYNTTPGGESLYGAENPFYGKTHTSESRLKMSQARAGKYKGPNCPAFGRVVSEETRRKQSLAKRGKPGPWLGKTRDKQTVQKVVDAHFRHDMPNERVVALRQQGHSCASIASMFGVSRSAVSWRLKQIAERGATFQIK